MDNFLYSLLSHSLYLENVSHHVPLAYISVYSHRNRLCQNHAAQRAKHRPFGNKTRGGIHIYAHRLMGGIYEV
jgi:hypothetical protein